MVVIGTCALDVDWAVLGSFVAVGSVMVGIIVSAKVDASFNAVVGFVDVAVSVVIGIVGFAVVVAVIAVVVSSLVDVIGSIMFVTGSDEVLLSSAVNIIGFVAVAVDSSVVSFVVVSVVVVVVGPDVIIVVVVVVGSVVVGLVVAVVAGSVTIVLVGSVVNVAVGSVVVFVVGFVMFVSVIGSSVTAVDIVPLDICCVLFMDAWSSVVLSMLIVGNVADVGTSTDVSEETVVDSLVVVISFAVIVVSSDASVVFAFDCTLLVSDIVAVVCCEVVGFDWVVFIVDDIGVSVAAVVRFLVVIASLFVADSSVLKVDIVISLVCRIVCVGSVLIVTCSVVVPFRPVRIDAGCLELVDITVVFAVGPELLACSVVYTVPAVVKASIVDGGSGVIVDGIAIVVSALCEIVDSIVLGSFVLVASVFVVVAGFVLVGFALVSGVFVDSSVCVEDSVVVAVGSKVLGVRSVVLVSVVGTFVVVGSVATVVSIGILVVSTVTVVGSVVVVV
ncbi:uncharacterized protein LOC128249710 [Octopus bimaculoides]|uniref:uncharacterized protein LOC128249710 n=1 Tax=Octopus bimaculoides TaxID=37653 RepID=UPI0022E69176|nr:uncharacterized protein LOC128249710 [Octopus bimaculoides]